VRGLEQCPWLLVFRRGPTAARSLPAPSAPPETVVATPSASPVRTGSIAIESSRLGRCRPRIVVIVTRARGLWVRPGRYPRYPRSLHRGAIRWREESVHVSTLLSDRGNPSAFILCHFQYSIFFLAHAYVGRDASHVVWFTAIALSSMLDCLRLKTNNCCFRGGCRGCPGLSLSRVREGACRTRG
jgi:hypothetical protein